jgi:hypothetical protein
MEKTEAGPPPAAKDDNFKYKDDSKYKCNSNGNPVVLAR